MFKNEEGFSLLELVVAVGVAGIIAAVALPTFAGLQSHATSTSATYAASASAAEALANSTIGNTGSTNSNGGSTSSNSSYNGGSSSSSSSYTPPAPMLYGSGAGSAAFALTLNGNTFGSPAPSSMINKIHIENASGYWIEADIDYGTVQAHGDMYVPFSDWYYTTSPYYNWLSAIDSLGNDTVNSIYSNGALTNFTYSVTSSYYMGNTLYVTVS